ncbi:hypothetical protein B0H34DRAFT_186508 [Crassisporium funariophilum]|nr:hypothetical protein B0H34DRAFT_186508 [Crassisporium funariophilum]
MHEHSGFKEILYDSMKRTKIEWNGRLRNLSFVSKDGFTEIAMPNIPPSSPVPHLIHSNTPPSERERELVEKAIALAQNVARLRHNESSRAGLRIRLLKQSTKFIRAHTAVLSPIRSIPTELIEEILKYCVCEFRPSRHSHWRELPFSLSQVCQKWRVTALSLPTLWNRLPTLVLGLPTACNCLPKSKMTITKRRKSPSFLVFLDEVLARSRDAPLSFYIYAPFQDYASHPIIDALVSHSHRWEEATIESSCVTINAFRRARGRIPRLRALSLEMWKHPGDAVIDLFQEAPQLRQVSVVGLYTHQLALPWSQLTQYDERAMNRGGLKHVLTHAVDLKTLDIRFIGQTPYYGTTVVPTLTLPHLVSLSLKLEKADYDILLSSLTLPSVKEIRVGSYQEDLVPHLTALIARSPDPCLLQKLTFRNASPALQTGELAKLLRLTPGLVELDLAMPHKFDLSDLVMSRRTGPPLVPLLEVLLIHSSMKEIYGKERILRNLALSRCEKPTHRIGWDEDAGVGRRELLHTELPELDSETPPRKRAFEWSFPRRLDRLLELIEKYEPGNVVNIYMSKLHISLRRLGAMSPNDIPGESKYHFRTRADDILNKWEGFIRADLVNMRWAMKGNRSLVYVPADDGKHRRALLCFFFLRD